MGVIKDIYDILNDTKPLISLWKKIRTNHQEFILFLLAFLLLLSFFFLYFYGEQWGINSNIILNSYYIAIPANIALFLAIILLDLPRPNGETILDKIPANAYSNFFLSKKIDDRNYLIKRAIISCKKFAFWWRKTFILMLLLYLFKGLTLLPNMSFNNCLIEDFIINFFDISSTVMFAVCLIIVSRITFVARTDKSKNPEFYYPQIITWYIIIASILIILDLILTFSIESYKYKIILSLFIGLFGGFVFSRFTGRIDSKYIGTKGETVYLFYFYSFLVVFFPLIHTLSTTLKMQTANSYIENRIELVNIINVSIIILLYLSYLLKIYFVYTIIKFFKTNKMLLYFLRINSFNITLDEQNKILKTL